MQFIQIHVYIAKRSCHHQSHWLCFAALASAKKDWEMWLWLVSRVSFGGSGINFNGRVSRLTFHLKFANRFCGFTQVKCFKVKPNEPAFGHLCVKRLPCTSHNDMQRHTFPRCILSRKQSYKEAMTPAVIWLHNTQTFLAIFPWNIFNLMFLLPFKNICYSFLRLMAITFFFTHFTFFSPSGSTRKYGKNSEVYWKH